MTLGNFANHIYKRTKTNSANWGSSGADMVIALNNANERALSLIRGRSDNFYPTAWTTSDLSTGTATPVFDSLFHELIPLWVSFQYLTDNEKPTGNIWAEIQTKEAELKLFYGTRNYVITTVTIASPGVFTRKNHGLRTGDRVILSTTGALPTGLSVATWYYVNPLTQDTFTLSSTNGGTAINTSVSQSGTHYFATDTPTGFTRGRVYETNK